MVEMKPVGGKPQSQEEPQKEEEEEEDDDVCEGGLFGNEQGKERKEKGREFPSPHERTVWRQQNCLGEDHRIQIFKGIYLCLCPSFLLSLLLCLLPHYS